MKEKRFYVKKFIEIDALDPGFVVEDKENSFSFVLFNCVFEAECVADLLNQQDKRIKELEEEVVYHKNFIREQFKTQRHFLEENQKLKEQFKRSQKILAISKLEWVLELLKYPNVYEHYKYHETLSMFLKRKITEQLEELQNK